LGRWSRIQEITAGELRQEAGTILRGLLYQAKESGLVRRVIVIHSWEIALQTSM
jgi:hypothetical protein